MSREHVRTSLDKKFEKHYFLYTQTQTLIHIYSNDFFHSYLSLQWSRSTLNTENLKTKLMILLSFTTHNAWTKEFCIFYTSTLYKKKKVFFFLLFLGNKRWYDYFLTAHTATSTVLMSFLKWGCFKMVTCNCT